MACLEHSDRVIYSVFVVDVDIDRCFLLVHEIGSSLSINTCSIMHFLLLLFMA